MKHREPPKQDPVHVRLLNHATLLRMMADGELRVSRADLRTIGVHLHLAACDLAREAMARSTET